MNRLSTSDLEHTQTTLRVVSCSLVCANGPMPRTNGYHFQDSAIYRLYEAPKGALNMSSGWDHSPSRMPVYRHRRTAGECTRMRVYVYMCVCAWRVNTSDGRGSVNGGMGRCDCALTVTCQTRDGGVGGCCQFAHDLLVGFQPSGSGRANMALLAPSGRPQCLTHTRQVAASAYTPEAGGLCGTPSGPNLHHRPPNELVERLSASHFGAIV